MINGLLILDKPAGLSSARAVDVVKRLLGRGVKIGHAGTLDPFATGVLVLMMGPATKLCETLMSSPKQYLATLKLGATTATDDPESPEIPWPTPVTEPSHDQVAAALRLFVGKIQQRPPAFSALKVAGRRAYKLARSGQPPDLPARTVEIRDIELLEFAWPSLRLRVDCGRGTYIRALARDIGQHLQTGAYLTQLRRTRVGDYGIEDAISLDKLDADALAHRLIAPHKCGG